jgi:hypothetical protein
MRTLKMIASAIGTLLFISAVGCSSNASATDTVKKIRTGLCQRWAQCFGDSFTQVYPNGQSQCVDEAMKKLTDAQKNSVSPCSDSEVNTCSGDITNASCDSVSNGDTSKLPSTCQKC